VSIDAKAAMQAPPRLRRISVTGQLPIVTLLALAGLAGTAPWVVWGLGLAAFAAVCGLVGWRWPERWQLPRILAVPAYLVMGNLAALHASIRAFRGASVPIWEPTRRPLT